MSMSQEPYGGQPPCVVGSETSEQAAASVVGRTAAWRERVYRHVQRCGARGATCWEIEYSLDLAHQTASARVRELVLKGRLRPSGHRRRTGSGRWAEVMVLAAADPAGQGTFVSARERIRVLEARVRALETENALLKLRAVVR